MPLCGPLISTDTPWHAHPDTTHTCMSEHKHFKRKGYAMWMITADVATLKADRMHKIQLS